MKLDNHDKALPADHIESFFKSLDLAGECGLWSIAAILLYDSSVARNIEHFGSSAAIALLDQWREKLGKAQEYEATHGANSLYVKDHPFNIEMEKLKELEKRAKEEANFIPTLALRWLR